MKIIEYLETTDKQLQNYIDEGLISRKNHAVLPWMSILHYTPLCDFTKTWNTTTMRANGLIYNTITNEIIGGSFKKMFHKQEHEDDSKPWAKNLDLTGATYQDSYDGSLVTVTKYDNNMTFVASRGSFNNPQVKLTKEIISEFNITNFSAKYTYIFELIHPNNTQVIDYGATKTLVLLAILDNNTLEEVKLSTFHHWADMNQVQVAHHKTSVSDTDSRNEGYVITIPPDTKVKVQTPQFQMQRAKINPVTSKDIWEYKLNRWSLQPLITKLPSFLHDWFYSEEEQLQAKFDEFYDVSRVMYSTVLEYLDTNNPNNKEFADAVREVCGKDYKDIIPMMFFFFHNQSDAKIHNYIFKQIKPTADAQMVA